MINYSTHLIKKRAYSKQVRYIKRLLQEHTRHTKCICCITIYISHVSLHVRIPFAHAFVEYRGTHCLASFLNVAGYTIVITFHANYALSYTKERS